MLWLLVALARQTKLRDGANEGRVLDSRGPSHPRETGVRCDVGIRVDFEHPGLSGLVQAHVHTTISVAADEPPCLQGNAAHLVGRARGNVGRTAWLSAKILLAAYVPFGSIRHHPPHTLGHGGEIDLRDWQDRVAD